ncbi:TelA-like protein [Babesia bigemina]|uniref:TelA-like protein n=1 Tax=Babesia bigemina TaxID=5866 RepID=A0A061D651_BABBI|nr:TelA-like protein [Babesia bigemina]CDR96176.1 TelA-like protein [Babesia bigemina]|eukprot:XP_012768362.1 TelA-like protein [Babesia bigemina]
MVRLFPGFLKKIIVHKGTSPDPDGCKRDSTSEAAASYVGRYSIESGASVNESRTTAEQGGSCTVATEEGVAKGDLLQRGITSNIATIALGEWGYPLYEDCRDDSFFSGKYFTGFLRNYVTSSDPLEDFISASRTKLIPKVEESDFAEYIRQISVFYATMNEDAPSGDGAEGADRQAAPSEVHVPREYYSEGYVLSKNDVFKEEVERIPEIMTTLEAQLDAVNCELQEMLERRYVHVHEACTSVEELHNRFLDVTKQINRIRMDLEGETTKGTIMKSLSTAPIKKEELDAILQKGISRKKELQTMLEYLQMFRAIIALPEYIQGIADSNGIAVANFLSQSVVNYLCDNLGKFKLAHSVAGVVSESILNIQRVAETKFINIALVALIDLRDTSDMKSSIDSLKTMLDQMHQPLIALTNASMLRDAMETLTLACKGAKAAIGYEKYDTWTELAKSFEGHKSRLLSYFFLSQVWGCMVLRRMLCVERMRQDKTLSMESTESVKLAEKVLSVVQDRMSSTNPVGNMTTVSTISALVSKTVVLPPMCMNDIDYWSIYQSGIRTDSNLNKTKGSDSIDADISDVLAAYVASIKHIVDTASKNSFDDFANHVVLTSNFKAEFDVSEFINFVESCKALKTQYERLQVDIKAMYLFPSMILRTLDNEWRSDKHSKMVLSPGITAIKSILPDEDRDITYEFRAIVDRVIKSLGVSCLEVLKSNNVTCVQSALAEEIWDAPYAHSYSTADGEVPFLLMKSCASIDERLNLYLLLAEALPCTGECASQDCTQLIEVYHSMIDAEVSMLHFQEADIDSSTMRKACLIAEALRYFSHRITDVVKNTINAMSAAVVAHAYEPNACPADLDAKRKGLHEAAGQCSDNLKSLSRRMLETISNEIGSKMARQMNFWVLQPSDSCYDDKALHDMIQIVQNSVDIVSKVLMDVADVQFVFANAFKQLHTVIPVEDINEQLKEDFRDSCAELITRLSHNTCIKLEIFSLADTLSNELFS